MLSPEAATLQLRERAAGYEQARSCNGSAPPVGVHRGCHCSCARALCRLQAAALLQYLCVMVQSCERSRAAAACALLNSYDCHGGVMPLTLPSIQQTVSSGAAWTAWQAPSQDSGVLQ